jgi:ABC-2 type transport system permease protein
MTALTLTNTLRDSVTMTRRELKHAQRFPMLLVGALAVPVVMLLMFDYVLGGTIARGLGAAGQAAPYIDYLMPGILVMTVAAGTAATAINVCIDMTGGIMDRFRTMPVSRGALLTGHVGAGVLRTLAATVAVTLVAVLIGFRPKAPSSDWLLAFGILAAFAFALAWLSAAFGLVAKSVAGANSLTLPIQFLLPFLSSTFVPADSMPAGVRWFSAHQPLTLVVDALRDLLTGTPDGNAALWALFWCAVIAAIGCAWAVALFNAAPRRQ